MRGSWAVAATATAMATLSLLSGRPALALTADKTLAQMSVENWQVKDGLPGDSIQAIEQASDGRLWIASFGGLVRYDGIRFSPITAPDGLKPSIADVGTLLATDDGAVWMGPNHRGPLQFIGNAARGFGPGDGLPATATAAAWATDGEGRVWMASTHALFKIDSGRFVPQAVQGIGALTITRLAVVGGTVWIGTTGGLFTVVGDRLVPPAGPTITGAVTALYVDRRRTVWIAAEGQLIRFADGKRTSTVTAREGLPRVPVVQIEEDDDDNLWLATAVGLGRVHDGRVALYTAKDGLPGNDVTALHVDRERGLWVGTRTGGLAQFTDRTLDTSAGPAMDGAEVLTLGQDDAGAFWFGTRDHGAVRWLNGQVTRYGSADGLGDLSVFAVIPGAPGEVWLGTTRGVYRWRDGKIDDPGIWPDRVRTMFRDHTGALWIGGDGVLGHYHDDQIERFTPEQGIMGGHLRAISEDAAGVLWVSGVGGLVRRTGDRFVKATPIAATNSGAIRSMLLDRTGAFWLTTTRSGLVRLAGGHAQVFDAKGGLEPEMLYALVEDDSGDLWIGTNKSILRVARSSLEAVADGRRPTVQVVSFEATDKRAGVLASQLRQPGAWKMRDGSLWFTTQNGPVRIDPRTVRTNTVAPHLNIETVLADARPVVAGGRGHVGARTGRLEFQFAAVTLLQPSKVRYRHILEGVDGTWVEDHDRRTAIYADLPAGNYRFRIQGSNNDGLWNERGASFSFIVDPPFYARLWFYLACAAVLLPFGLLVHRGHLARVRAQYLGMFTERLRISRELHDTLLQGMSSVALQLHALRAYLPDDRPEARRTLEQVHDTVTQCLRETRHLVRGLRAGDREIDAAAGALGPALSRLARRLHTAVVPANTSATTAACEVQVEGDPRALPNAVEDELYRIGQEAITNALKHAEARRIDVRLSYESQAVRLVVADDGRGFDPNVVDQSQEGEHFGLRGLRERAARIGATLDVRSRSGAGTVIEATVPAERAA